MVAYSQLMNVNITLETSLQILNEMAPETGARSIDPQRIFEQVAIFYALSVGDLMAIVVVTLLTIAVLFLAYKYFLFATFDGEVAQFYGVPTGWVETLFSLVLAATIVVSMQVLGVLLIAGATVIPPVSARMLSDRFRTVLLLSTGLGAACGFVGIYLSFFIDVSSGAAVVLVEAGVFALVMAYSNFRPRRVPNPLDNVHRVGVGQASPGEPD